MVRLADVRETSRQEVAAKHEEAVHMPKGKSEEEVEQILKARAQRTATKAATRKPLEKETEDDPPEEEGRQVVRVKLQARDRFLERGVDIPGAVWMQKPFRFNPIDFSVGNDRMKDKIFSAETQHASLDRFLDDPKKALIYGVGAEPSDQHAKYFAAWLVQMFLKLAPPNSTVLWHQLVGGFDNPMMHREPSLLVLTGLTPNSTGVKLEKARDLLEQHSSIPRIVVVAGEDPITFFATRLYLPIHNLYFNTSPQVRRKVEVDA